MEPVIGLASRDDAERTQEIYDPIVRDTAISFELEVPTVPKMRRRILGTLDNFPWLVCEHDGDFLGYCYAGPHRDRAAYQLSVEVQMFVQW